MAATSAASKGNAADTASKEEASAPHELNGVRHSRLSQAFTRQACPRVLTVKIELMSACGTSRKLAQCSDMSSGRRGSYGSGDVNRFGNTIVSSTA